MKFRLARHTHALSPLVDFYRAVLGLEVLGSFTEHQGYNGVFVGIPGLPWHLEFTESGDAPEHSADPDDLIVFYASDWPQYDRWRSAIEKEGVETLAAKNPYWQACSVTIADPDGFRVVLVQPTTGRAD